MNKQNAEIENTDFVVMQHFFSLMENGIKEHTPLYGDSWKQMSRGKLYDRLKHKMSDFDLTYNPKKLVSLANLAMLLYIRIQEEPARSQNPIEMM